MEARTYLNFDLSIEIDDSGELQVVVLDSPAGEAHERHDWPFSDQDLEIFLLRVGHTRRGVRRIDSPEMEAARDFGEQLYDAVFSGQIGTSFERSIDEAERHGQGLRLRLRTDDAPLLSDVPWEYLYSTPLHRFLVVSTATPLVRYIEQSRLIPPLAVEEAVRILTMVSSPTDVADLDVEDEWIRINESLSDLTSNGLIDLRRLPEATMAALRRELRQRPYHVFHFIGHGSFDVGSDEGVLMFEDDRRRGHKVSGEHLGTILHDHESLRLVVLNSCEGARSSPQDPFGGTAQGLVRQGIPAVIGMQFEITDDAAITFSHDFYEAIADGYPVDAALAEARKAIFTSGNDVEWGTPVLHMRTPDGRIFDRAEGLAHPPPEGPDDLADRLADAERALLDSEFERAVVLLESIAHDYPQATIAADKLAAAKRSLRADRLYASARVLSQAEQWQAVEDRFVEIEALDPDFRDRDELLPAAQEALAALQRDARLDTLYREAEEASAAGNWNEAVRLLGLISAEDAEYRDVAALLGIAIAWRDAGTIRASAQEEFDDEDWQAVVHRFDELRLLGPEFSEDPDDLESRARARLDEDKTRRRLQAEYDAAIALVEEQNWNDAIQILDNIATEQPDYPGIDKLRTTVREQLNQKETTQPHREAAALLAGAASASQSSVGIDTPNLRDRSTSRRAMIAIAAVLAIAAASFGGWLLFARESGPTPTTLADPGTTSTATTVPPSSTVAPIIGTAEPVCGNEAVGFVAVGQGPMRLILDTAFGLGDDDVGALAVLHALANAGEVEILGVVVSNSGDEYAHKAIDAVNTYYGRPDIPIGVTSGPAPAVPSQYTERLATEFDNDIEAVADATTMYRQILDAEPDGSVTIVSVGYLSNLAALLASDADEYSELNGENLVEAKVVRWVAMGGYYPDSVDHPDGKEFHFAQDVQAAVDAVTAWPTPVVYSGWELGSEIHTGAVLQGDTRPENPVRDAYRIQSEGENAESFDLTAVLYAVQGTADFFEECQGQNVISPDGSNQWQHRATSDSAYLRATVPHQEIADHLDKLLTTPPQTSAEVIETAVEDTTPDPTTTSGTVLTVRGVGDGNGTIFGFPGGCSSYGGNWGAVLCRKGFDTTVFGAGFFDLEFRAASGSWAEKAIGCTSSSRLSASTMACSISLSDFDVTVDASFLTFAYQSFTVSPQLGTVYWSGGSNCATPGQFTGCGANADVGTSVTFVAQPEAGAIFDHWTGPCAGQGATCTYTVTMLAKSTAHFVQLPPG